MNPGEDIARVTVIAPHRRIDLALPGEALLGEVLPTILRFAGHEGLATGEAVHTWVLQRVGEDPLDPNRQVSALGLRDGETLHLRQREAALPDAAFDDVIDAVSSTASTRPSWTARHSQLVALGALATVLVGGPFLLLLTDRFIGTVLTVLGLAIAAGIGAVVASRAYGSRPVASTLAWSSVALSFLAGWFLLAPMKLSLTELLTRPDAPLSLLIGCAMGLLAAAAMALAARVQAHALTTTALVMLLLTLVGVALAFLPRHVVGVCATAVAILLAVTPALPSLAYSVAGIALPNLPSQVDLLLADDQPVQADVVARATTADRLLACFLQATAVVVTLLMIPVVLSGTLPALLLAAAVALALLLRARAFVGLSQRLSLLLGGLAVAALAGAWATLHPDTGVLRVVVGALLVLLLTAGLALYAGRFHARIMSPVWGRMGDILEWIAIISILPLLLWLLDVYALARGLPG